MKFLTSIFSPYPFSINTTVKAAIFIALNIIFTHIFAIQTPFIRISFGFLPVAIFAILFGPVRGAITAAIADILGCLIFSPGLFFPGFTVSAFLSGMIYGAFLYNKQFSIQRIVLASLAVFIFVDLFMNTFWLTLLYHKAAPTFLVTRLIKCSIMLPIQVMTIYVVYARIVRHKAIAM